MSLDCFVQTIRRRYPFLAETADLTPRAWAEACAWLQPNEFDQDGPRGRGDSYRAAQHETGARATGVRTLLQLTACHTANLVAPVIDVLGGDGVIAKLHRQLTGPNSQPSMIVTGDQSAAMVAAALRSGLPAIRQPAQRLLFRDGVAHAVIIAYGTHHIPGHERPMAVAEANRVLRPGGRVLLHDFEPGSAMARWFGEVVDRYSVSGHPYEHISRQEFGWLLSGAGFADVAVREVADPFELVRRTADQAADALVGHVGAMYGLSPPSRVGDGRQWLGDLVHHYFGLRVQKDVNGWRAVLPRVALVGTGTKQ